MASKYGRAIKAIIHFREAFEKIDSRTPRKIAGILGEYYVLRELEKKGVQCEHRGGHAGYDIYVIDSKKRIEVRTSFLKDERIYGKGDVKYWGWIVQKEGQNARKFDVLVCVKLDDKFIKPRFFVFTQKEAFAVGNVRIPQFTNIRKKLCLYENGKALRKALANKPKLVPSFEVSFNHSPSRFLNKWDKITK